MNAQPLLRDAFTYSRDKTRTERPLSEHLENIEGEQIDFFVSLTRLGYSIAFTRVTENGSELFMRCGNKFVSITPDGKLDYNAAEKVRRRLWGREQ